jgi:hypothetical protein
VEDPAPDIRTEAEVAGEEIPPHPEQYDDESEAE